MRIMTAFSISSISELRKFDESELGSRMPMVPRSLARLPLSSIPLPERLITLAETNGSRYDYEG